MRNILLLIFFIILTKDSSSYNFEKLNFYSKQCVKHLNGTIGSFLLDSTLNQFRSIEIRSIKPFILSGITLSYNDTFNITLFIDSVRFQNIFNEQHKWDLELIKMENIAKIEICTKDSCNEVP